jgi:1-acyl-sn-glycerol-3-phosphate acyltransferase
MMPDVVHLIWTVVFLIPVVGISTVVLGAASLLSTLVDRRGYTAHAIARVWARIILVVTRVRVTVDGLQHLEPGRTYVFVANHQSLYDIPVLFWSLPFQLRIIAKESLGSVPVIGAHLKRTGHMLVDRRRPDRAGIFGWAGRLTRDGLSLIVFPEGTRSRDGRVQPFKGGSFYLAMQAGLPLVPLSIVGSRHIMRRGEVTARPGRVSLVIHPPLPTRQSDSPAASDVRVLAEQVREVIRGGPDAEAGR